MIPETFTPGYLLYLLEIFAPGIGLGELLNVWKRDDKFVEKLALSFGLGLAFDTLLIMVRTSGLNLLGVELLGLEPTTIYFIIGLGFFFMIAAFLRKRRLDLISRPSSVDLAVLALALAQALMIFVWLQKYPIFPGFESPDYGLHSALAQGLVSGGVASLPQGGLYFGIHYQLASALLLVGGEPLVTAQSILAILVVLSCPLFYMASARLFSSAKTGLAATAIYALSGTIWFNSVFTSGLYPNFFGILALLFFLAAFMGVADRIGSWEAWAVFLFALVMIYFSHYSSVTLFPAIIAIPLLKLGQKRSDVKRYVVPALVTLLPAAVGFLAFPSYEFSILGLAAGGAPFVVGSTPVASALSSLPVLSFMALETSNDLGFMFMLILFAVFVYRLASSRQALHFVPLVWFLALALASAVVMLPTRLAFTALLPLNLMAGYGLATLLPKMQVSVRERRRGSTKSWKYLQTIVILAVIMGPIVVNSWGQYALSDGLTNAGTYSKAQGDVYSAMYWLKDNTPGNSSYLAITDWRFTYTNLFFQRTTTIAPIFVETGILKAAKAYGAKYLIVTYYFTVQPPTSTQVYPWNSIQPSSNFTLLYSNDDVKVFKLTF